MKKNYEDEEGAGDLTQHSIPSLFGSYICAGRIVIFGDARGASCEKISFEVCALINIYSTCDLCPKSNIHALEIIVRNIARFGCLLTTGMVASTASTSNSDSDILDDIFVCGGRKCDFRPGKIQGLSFRAPSNRR